MQPEWQSSPTTPRAVHLHVVNHGHASQGVASEVRGISFDI